MFCVISLLLLVSNVLALLTPDKTYYDLADAEKHFADFIQNHEKKYESAEEYNKRFEIFKSRLENINNLNEIYEASFAVNEFSDLTTEEFARTHLCVFPPLLNLTDNVTVKKEWILNAPDSLDYRTQNLVTQVKNQGACGSCYIFSAVGNIEGQHAKQSGELIRLSEQQCVDCGTSGCEGGWPANVMNALAQYGGSMLEDDYPYQGVAGTCHSDSSKVKAKVLGGQEIDTGSEEELKGALAQYGPLSVCYHVNTKDTRDYHGGVMSPVDCLNDGSDISHCVLAVGYGTDEVTGLKYWLLKNSWGTTWGEQGYFRLEVNKCLLGTAGTANAMVG